MPTLLRKKRATLQSTPPCKREATSRMPEVKSPSPIWQFHLKSQNSWATIHRTERSTTPTSEPQDARARSVGILKLPLQVRYCESSKSNWENSRIYMIMLSSRLSNPMARPQRDLRTWTCSQRRPKAVTFETKTWPWPSPINEARNLTSKRIWWEDHMQEMKTKIVNCSILW